MNYILDDNIVKACAGIVGASPDTEPYRSAILQAEQTIGADFAQGAQGSRERLIKSVKLNLVNRKENPFEDLRRRYDLPIGKNGFADEKKKFCYQLAKNLGMI
ncbi:MAG TPA: hypothetical protein VHP31_12190 [Caproicibacter sp.]|nr:hypothetical protein [Caproicibacter sp.]